MGGIQHIFVLLIFIFVAVTDTFACLQGGTQNISIETGQSFYKECQCTEPRQPKTVFKWLNSNDEEINEMGPGTAGDIYTNFGDHSISLQIPKMSATLNGVYKCVAQYGGKSTNITYYIEAYEPLVFINVKRHQFPLLGKDSFITCEIRGDKHSIMTWYKDEELILATDSEKYKQSKKGLLIRNTSNEDSGSYRCKAFGLLTGEVIERDIEVKVITLPTISEIRVTPNSKVLVDDLVMVECLAEGTPHPDYEWKFLGQSQNDTMSWDQVLNTITFKNIQTDNNGTYECIAKNSAGEARSRVDLHVLVPPNITEFSNVTAAEGSTIQIMCKATGYQLPETLILPKDYLQIPDERSVSTLFEVANDTVVSYFTILKVDRSHEGFYICNATNEADYVTEEIYLTVAYKPEFEVYQETIYGWDEKVVNISCEHESYPPSTIEWKFQGNEVQTSEQIEINRSFLAQLNGTDDQYLTLPIAEKLFYGDYECIARNMMGEAKKTITLKQALPPPEIKNVTIFYTSATYIIFIIEAPEIFEGPPVIGFTSTYDETETYNISSVHRNRTWALDRPILLEDLKALTNYSIKFAAVNEVGVGPWTVVYEFETMEPSAPYAPVWDENLELIKQADSKVVLKWKSGDDNGDPVDYYAVRYCPNEDTEQKDLCQERVAITTELELDNLKDNTTYYVELVAHNSMGNSTAISTYVVVAAQEHKPLTHISAGAIIFLAVLVVLICLLMLDVVLYFWRKQGIIASCVKRNRRKKIKDNLQTKDKKGLLNYNVESIEDPSKKADNEHKEYEYNKRTGFITGKHSSV